MNTKLIDQMIKALNKLAQRHGGDFQFDMGWFARDGGDFQFDMGWYARETDCGTAGCLIGLACSLRGLQPVHWTYGNGLWALEMKETDPAGYLFGTRGPMIYCRHPEHGAAMLSWFLENPDADGATIGAKWLDVCPTCHVEPDEDLYEEDERREP